MSGPQGHRPRMINERKNIPEEQKHEAREKRLLFPVGFTSCGMAERRDDPRKLPFLEGVRGTAIKYNIDRSASGFHEIPRATTPAL